MDKKYIALNTLPGFDRVADGYFWNKEDNSLYSNKVGGYLVRLLGNVNGSARRYTLQVKAGRRYFPSETMSVRQDLIKSTVGNRLMLKETSAKVVAPSKGWIIGSMIDGKLSISPTPKIHTTDASVNTEIERLAKLNPGKYYVKMKLEAFAKAGGVSWS